MRRHWVTSSVIKVKRPLVCPSLHFIARFRFAGDWPCRIRNARCSRDCRWTRVSTTLGPSGVRVTYTGPPLAPCRVTVQLPFLTNRVSEGVSGSCAPSRPVSVLKQRNWSLRSTLGALGPCGTASRACAAPEGRDRAARTDRLPRPRSQGVALEPVRSCLCQRGECWRGNVSVGQTNPQGPNPVIQDNQGERRPDWDSQQQPSTTPLRPRHAPNGPQSNPRARRLREKGK